MLVNLASIYVFYGNVAPKVLNMIISNKNLHHAFSCNHDI